MKVEETNIINHESFVWGAKLYALTFRQSKLWEFWVLGTGVRVTEGLGFGPGLGHNKEIEFQLFPCLLYTSDAADE